MTARTTGVGDAQPEPGSGIEVREVQRRYGPVVAVQDLTLSVAEFGRIAIVGPSGCGKSTILAVLGGLEEMDEGSIDVLGARTPQDRLTRCAWMPQRDLLVPWRTVIGNVCLSLENRGVRRQRAREQVAPLFARFGLQGFEDHRPGQLSGGMRQRAAFLRTLVAGKQVLLLDEPFGALDSITRSDLQMWLLTALDAEPRTVVLVTHDVEEAVLLADEVVVLSPRPGRVIARIPSRLPAFSNRRQAIATPEFVAIREAVLTALET